MEYEWYRLAGDKLRDSADEQPDGSRVITVKRARYVLGRYYHIPKDLQVRVLAELLEIGFLERINKKKLRTASFGTARALGMDLEAAQVANDQELKVKSFFGQVIK